MYPIKKNATLAFHHSIYPGGLLPPVHLFMCICICLMNMYCGPTECWARDKAMNKKCKMPGFMVFIFPLECPNWSTGTILVYETEHSDTKLHIVVNRKGKRDGVTERVGATFGTNDQFNFKWTLTGFQKNWPLPLYLWPKAACGTVGLFSCWLAESAPPPCSEKCHGAFSLLI